VERFIDDDAAYVAWLADHPGGFVLNTFPHVSSSYLVLHRASCRTVNRPLAAGRHWTHQYGKACSDDRSELAAWALRETGKDISPCGSCLGGDAHAERPPHSGTAPARSGHGPRAPRIPDAMTYEGEPIRIAVVKSAEAGELAGPGFVIEGAQWLAEIFFRSDPSASGRNSYDSWIATTQRDPGLRDVIVDADITAVNRTMAARTPHSRWASVISGRDWSWLEALDPRWNLFDLTSEEWADLEVPKRLGRAFAATKQPGLGIAAVTKVLHIKRPGLIPVLDSLVVDQIGAQVTKDVFTWVAALERVREVGRGNIGELGRIRDHLESRGIEGRSLVRILDALLWTSSPGSAMYGSLAAWERVFRPSILATEGVGGSSARVALS
jgi:hypothetical protein